MEELYKDQHVIISYQEDKNIIESKWYLPATAKDEDFKNRMRIFADWVTKRQPKAVYTDTSETHYILVPEIQDWVNDLIPGIYREVGLKKLAVLANEDFIMHLALQQSINEDKDASYLTEYFQDETEARLWLDE